MIIRRFVLFAVFSICICTIQAQDVGQYNITWTKQSEILSDGMPVGNGSSGAIVTVINGKIWISLRHTDAWSEAHRLLKLGDFAISFYPNPFDQEFQQKLILEEAAVNIQGKNGFTARVWIDANEEKLHIQQQSEEKLNMKVELHHWRNKDKIIDNEANFSGVPIMESADSILSVDNTITWLHSNKHSIAFETAYKALEIGHQAIPYEKDILSKRVFGASITGNQLVNDGGLALKSRNAKNNNNISVSLHVCQPCQVKDWQDEILNDPGKTYEKTWQDHVIWWDAFWDRSFIEVTGSEEAKSVSAGYAYVMYMNALAGRGNFPIMWNGSIFSPRMSEVPSRNFQGVKTNDDPDRRTWGNLVLHQNFRLPYYDMLAAGQNQFIKPFFDWYMRGLPLMKKHTRQVFGHSGAVIRESTTLWGITAPAIYGIAREGLAPGQQASVWHRTHWQSGLEVAWFMAEYFKYTQNNSFATDTLIPFANEIIKFFDTHWPHENGKLHFPHVYVLETFRDTDNPMPFVAGMKAVLQSLLELPISLTSEADRIYWQEVLNRTPAIPTRKIDKTFILANAETIYSPKVNVEVGELYALFPYHLYGVGLPGLEMVQNTFKNRTILVNDVGGENPEWSNGFLRGGWRQEPVMAAMAGLTEVAREEIVWSFNRSVPELRFPGFFLSTYDAVPDVQHGAMAAAALQKMVLQEVDGKIIIMPAWPVDWNSHFRLFTHNNTIIEGEIKLGKVVGLKTIPEERINDVYVGQKLKKYMKK